MRNTNPPSTRPIIIPDSKLNPTEPPRGRIVAPDPVRLPKQRDELPPLKPLLPQTLLLREFQDDGGCFGPRGGPGVVSQVGEAFLGEGV